MSDTIEGYNYFTCPSCGEQDNTELLYVFNTPDWLPGEYRAGISRKWRCGCGAVLLDDGTGLRPLEGP